MGSAESFDAEDEFPMMSVREEERRDGGMEGMEFSISLLFQSPLGECRPRCSCAPHESKKKKKKNQQTCTAKPFLESLSLSTLFFFFHLQALLCCIQPFTSEAPPWTARQTDRISRPLGSPPPSPLLSSPLPTIHLFRQTHAGRTCTASRQEKGHRGPS